MNTYSSYIEITTDKKQLDSIKTHACLHKGMGTGRILSDAIKEAFRKVKKDGSNVIAFYPMGGMNDHETARAILRCIFAYLRDCFDEKERIVIFCNEQMESIFADCFWDESLTLLGKREAREEYKLFFDNRTKSYWDRIFSYIPEIEKGHEGFEEHLGLCFSYLSWINVFDKITPADFEYIRNIYWLGIIATRMSRTPHWCYCNERPEDVLAMYKALQEQMWIYPYIFELRVIAELHNRGYELLRICPSVHLSWRCIATTKDNTYEQCGAICADQSWGPTTVNISFGELFKDEDPTLDIQKAADRFCKEYPKLVKAAKGSDPAYKKWFRHVLHLAQQGQLFYAFEDMGCCVESGRMLGTTEPLPFPPAGTVKGIPGY